MDDEGKKLVHSLNNALSIISAFAATLAEEIGPDDPRRESVDEIVRAAKQAAAVARQLAALG